MDVQSSSVDRRDFLKLVGAAAAGLVVGGVAGYGVASTTLQAPQPAQQKQLKAGFIYVGPVGDFGWTKAHDDGRKFAEAALPWLKTSYIESVAEAEVEQKIESLIAGGAKVIFTTSFGFMDGTANAASKHPDLIFEHCSGYRSGAAGNAPQNMGTYFAEFYQLYYLCGLAAGAMTKTNNLGYVAAFLIPEVVRHINAFVLGAREVNPNVKLFIRRLGAWYSPDKARTAAVDLIENENCDVLAFTEDSPTVLQVAQQYTTQRGKRVWSFSHYNDMASVGPDAHLTGQIVNWGPIYVDLLTSAYAGSWASRDIWARAGDYMPYRWRAQPRPELLTDAATLRSLGSRGELGAVYPAPLNSAVPDQHRALFAQRWEEMRELLFEPFTGPIRDQDGALRVKEGERLGRNELWTMNWFVEGVETRIATE
jgi:simple sugar transport system substrate-binding protein